MTNIMKEYDKITAYCTQYWKAETEHVKEIADMAVERAYIFNMPWDMEQTPFIVRFTDKINWEHMPEDDIEFIYQLNRHRFFICLAQAWAMTGDEKYALAFRDQILDWIERCPLTEKAYGTTWRTLETGIRGDYWVKALEIFEGCELIDSEVREKIYGSMRVHMDRLAASDGLFQWKSNWGFFENMGLLKMALYVPDFEKRDEYVKLAMKRLERQAVFQSPDDGCHWEQSPNYHNEVFMSYMETLRLAEVYDLPFSDEYIAGAKRMAYADMMWQKPNHCQPMGGDSDEEDQRDILSKAAHLFQDPVLKFMGYPHLDFNSVWEFGYGAALAYEAMEAQPPQEKDFAMEDSGNYIIRSGWEENADYFKFRCGPFGGGHGHSEKLHIDLVFDGEDILMDAGRYTYVFGEDRLYYKGAWGHNVPMVDKDDYIVQKDSWGMENTFAPTQGYMRQKNGYTYFEGGNPGYYQKGVFVLRQIVALGTSHYIISDTFYGNSAHTYEQLFHFNSAGKVTVQGNTAVYRGEKTAAKITFLTEGVTLEQKTTHISRHYNSCEENQTITASAAGEGLTSMVCVVSKCKDTQVKAFAAQVKGAEADVPVDASMARGIVVEDGGKCYTVVISYYDIAGPGDLYACNGHIGAGRILIFDEAEGAARMTVLKR